MLAKALVSDNVGTAAWLEKSYSSTELQLINVLAPIRVTPPGIDTPIREGVAIREAQLLHEPIFTYAPRSNPARDFMALLDAIQI